MLSLFLAFISDICVDVFTYKLLRIEPLLNSGNGEIKMCFFITWEKEGINVRVRVLFSNCSVQYRGQ
jgi:hypothetical protein